VSISHFPWSVAPQASPEASVDITTCNTLSLCYGPHGLPISVIGGEAQ
jgi:hypothetical protein